MQQAARDKPLLLISHHAAPQIHKRQTDLLTALKTAFPGLPIRRVGVWVNRAGATRGTEYTQRTRSLLFWAIGLAVGVSIKAGEYPTMRWATRGTKPDWSDDGTLLWVELKYVRKKANIGPIEGAIAQDVTRYGDLDRRCLFVTYDPHHHVLDKDRFSAPVNRRPTMVACIVR